MTDNRIVPGIKWQREQARLVGQQQRALVAGFGLAIAKREGTVISYTGDPKPRRPRKGEKRPVENDWMELPIPKNMGRARVHKMVDEWLDDRARGFRGSR